MTDLQDPPIRTSVTSPPGEGGPADGQGWAPPEPVPGTPKAPGKALVVVGGSLAALVLVAYFVWLSIQMGSHAQTGAAPMIAVFASAALGVGAGALAFRVGRRNQR